MKTKIILIVFMVATLISCDLIKDATTVDIDTTLDLNVPVTVTAASAMALKSASATSNAFSQTATLSLTSNEDIEKYVNKIKSVTIESADASILGLESGQVIESMTVAVTGIGTILTLSNFTSASTIPAIPASLLTQIGDKLETDHSLTVTINGSTNVAPMLFDLQLEMDAAITAGAL